MSRWLLSVNSILERLDGQVENVVEERAAIQQEEESELLEGNIFDTTISAGGGVTGKKDVVLEGILAKRGLADVVAEDEDDNGEQQLDDHENLQKSEGDGAARNLPTSQIDESIKMNDESVNETDVNLQLPSDLKVDTIVQADESVMNQQNQFLEGNMETSDGTKLPLVVDEATSSKHHEDAGFEDVEFAEDSNKSVETPIEDTNQPTATTPLKEDKTIAVEQRLSNVDSVTDSKEHKEVLVQAREAQKEARTLRRHVVSLNSQLENAEAEIQAQRNELERAAERIEKDRLRNKEEREKEKIRNADELKALKQQHESALVEQKKRFEQQLEDSRQQLRHVEERRMQEGGDWNKELVGALEREKEMVRKVSALEDERATMLSQISTLQAQQDALGTRLESLTQTTENAMERERDAEDRLDAALSLHARQLSQRQSREAALERTISELGAALAVARDREIQRLKAQSAKSEMAGDETEPHDAAIRLESVQHELDTVQAQLLVERQRSDALQKEMRDIAKERADEASAARTRQLQYDRQVAEMSLTISRFQMMTRESKKSSSEEIGDGFERIDNDDTQKKQIRDLSEEVIRQREKVSSYSSEVSALKIRLQVALDRASKAEAALTSSGNGVDAYDVMEQAPFSGNGGMRRRGGASRRPPHDTSIASITAAMRLDTSHGKGTERIGKAIDALDSFSVETGKYLRYNPLARGAFILYLLLLHVWTFGLLFFHTHVFEPVHGDFGAGAGLAHGPHALMSQRDNLFPPQMQDTTALQATVATATAAAVKNSIAP